VTLTVGYPRRSKFFGSELKEFLILTKENELAVDEVVGSYAGAVGYPQFISSSYRHYAVDFSGDGKADLIDDPVDAIGSVANYFIKNGWKPGEPVTSVAHNTVESGLSDIANRKRKVQFTAQSLRDKGAPLADSIDANEKLNVLMLNASEVVAESSKSDRYVVRAGDTACRIAESVKVSCRSLFTLNKLNKKGDIYRGQVLKLPSTAKKTSAAKKVLKQNKGSKWEVAKASGVQQESLDSTVKERFFFTHHNFYAITEYNHSVLYAMAVYELSNAIQVAKDQVDENPAAQ
jgi:membrane-bound lytic murein transglycosylase B